MRKSIVAFLVFAFICLQWCFAETINDLEINSRSVYMVNLDNGQVMLDKNSDKKMEPASLTKIMTSLVVLENCKDIKNEKVTVEDDSLFYEIRREGGANLALKTGETFTVEDLLYATMLHSACDAAELLAYHFGGGDVDAFVEMMNARAAEIGAKDTLFRNPHGLDADGHVTTAYDMYLITREALKNSQFSEIISHTSYIIPETEKSRERNVKYRVELVNKASANYYRYAMGIKTGFTDLAGRCLVTMAKKDEASYLLVLMGANLDGEPAPIKTYGDATRLFEYVFNAYSLVDVAGSGEKLAQTQLAFDATNKKTIDLMARDRICLLLPHGVTADMTQAVYEYRKDITLPLMTGQEVGTVSYMYDGEKIAEFVLLSGTDVYDTMPDGELKYYPAEGFNTLTFWKTFFVICAVLCIIGILHILRNKGKKRARRNAPPVRKRNLDK